MKIVLLQSHYNVHADTTTRVFFGIKFVPEASSGVANVGSSKFPVAMVNVIDVSSSMEGEKLDTAKKAAKDVISTLSSKDSYSLVEFSDDAKTIIPLSSVSKNKMVSKVDDLVVRGVTNLYDGIETGIKQLKNAESSHRKKIVVFTDGGANEGRCDLEDFKNIGKIILDEKIDAFFAGIGEGYNEKTLVLLSETAGGKFKHAQNPEDIRHILSDITQKAVSIDASGVEIKIKPIRDAKISILSKLSQFAEGFYTVSVGDIPTSEEMIIFGELISPKRDSGHYKMASFEVAYYDRAGNKNQWQDVLSVGYTHDEHELADTKDDGFLNDALSVIYDKMYRETSDPDKRTQIIKKMGELKDKVTDIRRRESIIKITQTGSSKEIEAELDKMKT